MKLTRTFTALVAATAVSALSGAALAVAGDNRDKDDDLPFVKAADANGDNIVSKDEFRNHLKSRFKALDTNKDGWLVEGELPSRVAMVKDKDASDEDFVDELDDDNDGRVSESEYTLKALNEFDDADENNDGRLTREERDDADSFFERLIPDL